MKNKKGASRKRAKKYGMVKTLNPGDPPFVQLSKVTYGNELPPVGFWLTTSLHLGEKMKAHDRQRNKLGTDKISQAYIAWNEMRSAKDKERNGTSDEAIFKIAKKHPDMNLLVFDFLKVELAIRAELATIYSDLGNVIFWAIYRRDLSFFRDLTSALQSEGDWPVDKVRSTILRLTWIRETPVLTLKLLTMCLNEIFHRTFHTAYVARLCKELGVPLKPGKPGPPFKAKLTK